MPSHSIYFPRAYAPPDVLRYHDVYNLALETGQHLSIQKSEARKRVEDEVYGQWMEEIEKRHNELEIGVYQYYGTPLDVPRDYLLQLVIDDWAARGLSEGFGHLIALGFTGRKTQNSPFSKSIREAFPVRRNLVDNTPVPDKYGIMQERLGTLYVAHNGQEYQKAGLKPRDLARRMIGIKREELPQTAALMKQLYISLP